MSDTTSDTTSETILLMGRYEYNIGWLTDLLFPSWVLNLSFFSLLEPDWEAEYEAYRNFNLYSWFNSEDASPFAWIADDLAEYLTA